LKSIGNIAFSIFIEKTEKTDVWDIVLSLLLYCFYSMISNPVIV